jgi:hypothetical protein
LSGGKITARHSPIFCAFDNQDPRITISGVANLPRNLTINSITVAPTFWYKGQDANATDTKWYPEIGGSDGILTEAGAGASPSYAQATPLLGTDQAVKYNAVKYHGAAGNAFGDVTTEDMVVELVGKKGTINTGRLYSKWNGAVGVAVVELTNAIRFYANATAVAAGVADGVWYHAMCFYDASGSAVWYINGAQATAVLVSGVGSVTLATPMSIGGPATLSNCGVAQLAMWKRAAWLDTHLQATIAKQRFRALTGFKPQINTAVGVDAAPLNWTRSTVATLQKYNPVTGADEMYTVGSYWLRAERWMTSNGVFSGYRSELTRTNLLTYSHVTEATWTKADAGDTTTTVDGPWGTSTAEGWVADATDGDHSRLLACTTTAAVHAAFVRVKAGTCPVVAIHDSVSNVGRYFTIATGALGGAMGGAPTVS